MREIKFRSWDLMRKKMEGWEDQYADYGAPQICEFFEKENQVLMQYTGLKDKNGKEIYEGDIVKIYPESCPEDAEDEKNIMVIKWNDQGGYISEYQCGYEFDPLIGNDELEMEIIGNIYENPELLTPSQTLS